MLYNTTLLCVLSAVQLCGIIASVVARFLALDWWTDDDDDDVVATALVEKEASEQANEDTYNVMRTPWATFNEYNAQGKASALYFFFLYLVECTKYSYYNRRCTM